MIQLTREQLTVLVDLAVRAPKSPAEKYALDLIVKLANQQIANEANNDDTSD
jgi:hypothetical protein